MSLEHKTVIINSRKFDGSLSRSWKAKLLNRSENFYTLVGVFDFDVHHEHLGFIRRGTVSYEFFWKNRCYNVFRFHEPEGNFRNYYCNLSLPPKFENGILDFVDLDVDVFVDENYQIKILDSEEFESNAVKYSYPESVKLKVERNLRIIKRRVEGRKFPFDFHLKNPARF